MTATSVWVVDSAGGEVYEFNHTGTLQNQFDTAGAGAANPRGISVTATSVWVVDDTDDEVYEFNSQRLSGVWPRTTTPALSAPQRAATGS